MSTCRICRRPADPGVALFRGECSRCQDRHRKEPIDEYSLMSLRDAEGETLVVVQIMVDGEECSLRAPDEDTARQADAALIAGSQWIADWFDLVAIPGAEIRIRRPDK